jgi:FtsP/CotA-like multicopper oxidase with cupredoxin domain
MRKGLTVLIVPALLIFWQDAHAQHHQHGPSVASSPAPIERTTPPAATDTIAAHPVLPDQSDVEGIVEVVLVAAPERLELVPGTETNVLAYNGRVPGPLLEVMEGDSVIVHFRNELPYETTVHWHGLHLPFESDGSPFHPVAPGNSFTYAFRLKPGTAGTYWYHPHPHHHTAYQVGKGLYGGLIVRDPDDPLPDMTEHLLILSDQRFADDGSLAFAEVGTRQARIDEMNGREGDVLFVNDAVMPTLNIRSGETQRWRILNASGARIYRLALEDHTMLHVGSDGGLFEHPVQVDEILLANGERAEILISATGSPGSQASLQALPYDRYMPQWRPRDWQTTHDLLTLRYTDEPATSQVPIPDRLRQIPVLDESQATVTRTFLMSNGLINGKRMDMERVDETAELGATEIWEIENLVGMDHPFHLHGFQFQIIDRNGEPEDQRMWKDTVNVPAFERARFVVRLDNFPGLWMYHCHILDHEDQGMMGVIEVR